jgi:NitT/TauT family transport system permease protein
VAGLLLGAAIGQVRLLEKIFYPYVVAFQTVPKVAIAPIIIIWLGFGTFSKVVVTATIAFFPVLANTIVGLRAAPADQIELLVSLTARPMQVFWKVRVPQALPYIFVGLDVAIVLAVIGAIVGEFVGAQAGLGYMILQRNLSMDLPGVFAILVILSLIGVGLHLIVQYIRRKVVFWTDEGSNSTTGA